MAVSNGLKVAVKYFVQLAINDDIGLRITARIHIASRGKIRIHGRSLQNRQTFLRPKTRARILNVSTIITSTNEAVQANSIWLS